MPYRFFLASVLLLPPTFAHAGGSPTKEDVAKALRRAAEYFRTQVATEGGYLWRYSADLSRREGEKKATRTQIWIQPPGTPSVGLAYLHAYQATRDPYYLESARAAAMALVKGQLRSGGWDYFIDFDPKERKKHAYRVDAGSEKGRGMTTLDDNNTQEALRFLMRLDQTLDFKDATVHEATLYALSCLLQAQYPNGAWPQRYDRFPDPAKFPVKRASYPDSWSRTFPKVDYRGFYTFNDNAMGDAIEVMLEATRIYGDKKYMAAAAKAGGFILMAQMPEPQPAWAQQYDFDMHPAWARKFEPPSITGGESFGVMRSLLTLYRATGDKKYLEPIPRALAYFQRSQLSDGQLARFYELKTNRPLYFTKDYQLTYDDSDVPTHYRFKLGNRMGLIAKEYEVVKSLDPATLQKPVREKRAKRPQASPAVVSALLKGLDEQGRWLSSGRLRYQGAGDDTRRIIDCQVFIRNVMTLSDFLAAQ